MRYKKLPNSDAPLFDPINVVELLLFFKSVLYNPPMK